MTAFPGPQRRCDPLLRTPTLRDAGDQVLFENPASAGFAISQGGVEDGAGRELLGAQRRAPAGGHPPRPRPGGRVQPDRRAPQGERPAGEAGAALQSLVSR